MNYTLDDNIVKACAGIVGADIKKGPYRSAIEEAKKSIGTDFAPGAQRERKKLVDAIELNLTSRKKNPIAALICTYNIPVTYHQFLDEKHKFCYELAKNLGMI